MKFTELNVSLEWSIFGDKKSDEKPVNKIKPEQAYSKALAFLKKVSSMKELKPLIKAWEWKSSDDDNEIKAFKNGEEKEAWLCHFEAPNAQGDIDDAYRFWVDYYYNESGKDLIADIVKAIGDPSYEVYAEDKAKSCSFYIVNKAI